MSITRSKGHLALTTYTDGTATLRLTDASGDYMEMPIDSDELKAMHRKLDEHLDHMGKLEEWQ